jgi:hypothetical protein
LRWEPGGFSLEALGRLQDVFLETARLVVSLLPVLRVAYPRYRSLQLLVGIVLVQGTHH